MGRLASTRARQRASKGSGLLFVAIIVSNVYRQVTADISNRYIRLDTAAATR